MGEGKGRERTHGTQMHDPAILRCCIEVSLEIRCADEVDDDIDAFAVCSRKDFLGPVLGVVVEA